ncbi:MAG TPA: hypothetical protein VNN80_09580, partial [Polyangiaceae bacterium]|nr:hypothetical protein [Polyangiaceae bacterium]
AFGVLCATLVAARADAAQPNPASTKAHQAHPVAARAAKAEHKADKAEAKADKARAKADKAEAKADKAEAKAQAKADPAGAEKPDAKDEAAGADAEHGRGRGRGRGQHVSAMRALREEIRSGKLSKAEIDQRLAALKESARERRKAHREELGKRYGAALGNAATREELRHHGRRMAFLNRALVLAQSEKAGKDKDALIERIEKLIEKENARHEKAMDRFEPKRSATTTEPAAAKLPSEAEEEEDDAEGGAR